MLRLSFIISVHGSACKGEYMGKVTPEKHTWRPMPPAGPCLTVQRLVDRYNAREFDPFSFLTVCYCGEKFDRDGVPAPVPGEERMAVNYLVTGVLNPVDMPSGAEGQTLASTVGGLKQAQPSEPVDVLNLELWVKAFGETDGAGKRWELESENVPLARTGKGVAVRVLSGRFEDTPGAVFAHPSGTILFDVTLSPGAVFEYQAPAENTTFVYVFGGKSKFGRKGRKQFGKNSLLRTPGGDVTAVTYCSGARFLLFSGRPVERENPELCPQTEKTVCRVNGKK